MNYTGKIKSLARGIVSVLPAIAVLSFASCEQNEPLKSVDLRFLAEDSYLLAASDPEPIRIQVSSTDPWHVYGKYPDWSTITPSEGTALPVDRLAEATEVTIVYEDNVGLDDRIDTIVIQSDYWIGKWIQVIQKGTAYMEFDNPGIMPQNGGNAKVDVRTNHKWSAAVTTGEGWLSLEGAVSGEGDGRISFKVERNAGEVRTGIITIYDHNDAGCGEIVVSQDGVQLDPAMNQIRTDYKAKEYILHVESNGTWKVIKEDADVAWYSFPQTEFTGSQDLKINIFESPSTTVRTARFTISSVSGEEGVVPVTKQITLKQSYRFAPDIIEFTQGEIDGTWMTWGYGFAARGDDMIMKSGARVESRYRELGYATFKVKEMDEDAEFRIEFLKDGGTYNWVFYWGGDARTGMTVSRNDVIAPVPFDYTRPNEFSYYVAPDDNGYIYVEFMLNGDVVGSHVYDGADGGEVIRYPFDGHSTILFNTTSGAADDAVVVDWWGHCPVIDWGN